MNVQAIKKGFVVATSGICILAVVIVLTFLVLGGLFIVLALFQFSD